MKISARLLLGFMAIIFVVIAFSITVFLSVRDLTSYIGRLNELSQHQAMAGDLRFNVTLLVMPANDYIITGKKDEHYKDLKKQAAIVKEKFRNIEAANLSPEERKFVREIWADYEEIMRLTQAIFNIASPIGNQRAMRLMEEMDNKYIHPASEKATRLFDVIKEKREKVQAAAKKAEKRAIIVFTAGILIAFVISSVIAGAISRSISRPLGEMAALSQKIAQGDLDVAIETKRVDEIGVLAGAFNNMAVNLKNSQMEQRRLFEEEQKKVRQMAILHEAVAAIASQLSLEPLLEELSLLSALLVKAELSALVILHPETGAIQYFKANISPDDFPIKTMPKGLGLLGAVLQGVAPIRLADASSDSRFKGLPSGHPFIKGFLGIPMMLKNKVVGAIFAANKNDDRQFTEEDESLLFMLALQSAKAVENARLYTKTSEFATTDGLTVLLNRRAFMERLTEESARSSRYEHYFSFLLIDIDRFKWVNDTYGHPAGDAVLKLLAQVLKRQTRTVDIAGRYGGEEFAIILPETNASGAKLVGERIRSLISKMPFPLPNGSKIGLTVSMGIACFPSCADNIEQLIERADTALYSAKNAGRNLVYLYRETLIAQMENNPDQIALLLNQDIGNIEAVISSIDVKASFFREHTEKVRQYAMLLSKALGLQDKERDNLRLASLLHDIGFVATPAAILKKPGNLTDEEAAIMKRHPARGAEIIKKVAALAHLAPIIYSHHERHDGTGYPDGLKGEEIPYLSRVLAVADAFASMTSGLPWRKVMSKDDAIKSLKASAGSQFESKIADAFCRII